MANTKVCPQCMSGNVKIKAISETEYHDAVIHVGAEVKDGKIEIGFTVKGSYYIEKFEGTCENGHKFGLDELMDTEIGEAIAEALSVNDETHTVTRKLK